MSEMSADVVAVILGPTVSAVRVPRAEQTNLDSSGTFVNLAELSAEIGTHSFTIFGLKNHPP